MNTYSLAQTFKINANAGLRVLTDVSVKHE